MTLPASGPWPCDVLDWSTLGFEKQQTHHNDNAGLFWVPSCALDSIVCLGSNELQGIVSLRGDTHQTVGAGSQILIGVKVLHIDVVVVFQSIIESATCDTSSIDHHIKGSSRSREGRQSKYTFGKHLEKFL